VAALAVGALFGKAAIRSVASPMASDKGPASVRFSAREQEAAMWWKVTLAAFAVSVTGVITAAGAGMAAHEAQAVNMGFKMVEWDILPLTATKTTAGRVTFVVRNAGKMEHEFVVLRTAKAAGSLAPSTALRAPETGAVGEIESVKPGQVKRLTLNLKKGHYSLLCNLSGHYGKGQFVDFYVR